MRFHDNGSFYCTNCDGPLPEGHGTLNPRNPEQHFCDRCGGIAEALNIGNPRTSRAFLYDDGKGNAVTWGSASMGKIVHRNAPALTPGTRATRRLGATRYRVRMLDGSMWYGFGPTANGTYIRLRRMKGD